MKYYVIEPCKSSNGFEIKYKNRINIDLAKKVFEDSAGTSIVILTKFNKYDISIYSSGRIMIKSNEKMEKKDIGELSRKITAMLEEVNAL